jgi:hypothetical protein
LINLKWSVLAGAFGLVMSLLVGIISGAGFPMALIRALVFGAGFFVLAGGAWILINNFVPELLETGGEDDNSGVLPGSRLDISVGDGQESALPEMYRDSGEEVGDIADLISGKTAPAAPGPAGMDQKGEDGYTKNSGAEFQPEPQGSPAGSSAGGDSGPAEALPDLDSMASAFGSAGEEAAELETERPLPERSPTGNKPQNLQGDFHPKELAAAIRTRISKD